MIQDNDKLHGIVEVTVKLTDTSGIHEDYYSVVTRGFTLADVGTILQRETYELLRKVASHANRGTVEAKASEQEVSFLRELSKVLEVPKT